MLRLFVRGGRTVGVGFALVAVICGVTRPAFAIPSPELVVGSLTSLSQIGALLSAMLGGGAILAAGRGGRRPGGAGVSIALVVLALLTVGLAAANVYQWQADSAARFERLSATLKRPSRLPGQAKLDSSLKELSRAEQAHHPLGISAAEAEKIVADPEGHGFEIIDIREQAEVEMGTFAKARPIRYPDFLASRPDMGGKKALLICHNGNRSSETCQALKAMGIDCRFIIGGLEEWITEGRSAGGFHRASILESRAVPAYRNDDRLIDTPEARRLIEKDGAVVIDTRYPGEFAAGHLPGAVNIPMRRMTTHDLDAAFAALPKKPSLVACYDRRSCFFGELVGLRLSRMGRDFRGRYTVPWEYVPTMAPPPHVAAALAERNMSLWSKARRWLAGVLGEQSEKWGFLWVLAGLALMSRIVILPFAIKAEKDQIAARAIEPEMKALKAKLADDPTRRMRAIRQLYAKHGMTPVRNLVALLGLPILMLAGTAIGDAAAAGDYALWPFGLLAHRDPTFIAPVAGAVLIGIYADWALCTSRRHRLVAWLLAVPMLAIMLVFLPAATNLYVALSASLLLVQRALVVGLPGAVLRRVRGFLTRPRKGGDIIPLAQAGTRDDVGMKAVRLGVMLDAGLPVPDGVVLTQAFIEVWRGAGVKGKARLVRRVRRRLGRGPYAVRSSGVAEDQANASHAGIYESVTHVARRGLGDAIDTVVASFSGPRAHQYGTGASHGAVIVQQMIGGQRGGVLFTRAPDAPGLMLVEMVEGGAEDLVSGRGQPSVHRFGRRTGTAVGEAAAPFDLGRLVVLGRGVEKRFGAPQDVEWVWDGRRIWLVQSRDITANAAPVAESVLGEWERVLDLADDGAGGAAVTLVRNEMCELLPRPDATSQSLIEALYASGGSVDLACRELGLRYNVEEEARPLFPTLFGRLYQSSVEALSRAPKLTRFDTRRILRGAGALEVELRSDVLPAIERRLAVPAAADFDALAMDDLLVTVRETIARFVTETHVQAEVVNIVAEVTMGAARDGLKRAGSASAAHLSRQGHTLEELALDAAVKLPRDEASVFLRRAIGHRAALDYAIGTPRLGEDPKALEARLETYRAMRGRAAEAAPVSDVLDSALGEQVALARRMQTLKEDVKHVVLREIAVLRRALLALDARMQLGGRVFLLTIAEIAALRGDEGDHLRQCLARRATGREEIGGVGALPASLSLAEVELASWPGRTTGGDVPLGAGTALAGTRVAGSRRAQGAAFVVDEATAEAGLPLAGLRQGDVLVTPFVHPAWLDEVLRASGVISGSGGWLSHMAIIARERNVAMTVGVAGWSSIATGTQVVLELDGSVRLVADQPTLRSEAADVLGAAAS